MAAFAADPASSAQARRFVRSALDSAHIDSHVTDVAVLVASELVTNAVLHANAGPILSVHIDDEFVRLEVEDSSELFPLLRNYGQEAVTGRGLAVVEATANRWGVYSTQSGKTIWVEFSCDESKLGDKPDGTSPRRDTESITAAVRSASPKRFPLVFRQVPVDICLELEKHHEALLREFELLVIGADHEANGETVDGGADLVGLIESVRTILATAMEHQRGQLDAARNDRCTYFDMSASIDDSGLRWLEEFGALTEVTDGYCERGSFLTAPLSHEARALRRWAIEEAKRQYVDRLAPRAAPRS